MENLGQIGLSEAQADLLNVAASFCAEKSPMEAVRKLIESPDGFDKDIWREIAALGWLGVAIPEAYGGVGLSLAEVTPIMEQMGKAVMANPYLSTTLAAQAVLIAGDEAQKSQILPAICEGAAASVALIEPNEDWRLGEIEATATKDGDEFKLSGTKRLVMDAMVADWLIISVRLDGAPALMAVPGGQLGDENCRREVILDETKRSYEIKLDGLRAPQSALLDQAKTLHALDHLDQTANLLLSAEMAGACDACINYTLDYLRTRKQFGRTIGSYQSLKHPMVDAYIEYEQARSHVYAAAHSFNDQGAGEVAVRMAKAQSLKALSFAADRSIQFHGGFGFTYDCDAQLYRRRALFNASQYGDEAWQRKKLAELLF